MDKYFYEDCLGIIANIILCLGCIGFLAIVFGGRPATFETCCYGVAELLLTAGLWAIMRVLSEISRTLKKKN